MYTHVNFGADFVTRQCRTAMLRVRLIDEQKCHASLPCENIAQFCRCKKFSLLLLSAVLTGHFPVYLRPKVASKVTIGVAQFYLKVCFNYRFNKKYSFSFYFALSKRFLFLFRFSFKNNFSFSFCIS